MFRRRSWTEGSTIRSRHAMQSHLKGLAIGCLYFITPPAGQGRARQPAQMRAHTHQHGIKRRKEAVQALGRDVRLLVGITQPLNSRNAKKRKGPSQERDWHTLLPRLFRTNTTHPRSPGKTLLPTTPFLGTCRPTPGHYSTTRELTGGRRSA